MRSYLKVIVIALLFLLTIGAPGQTDLGNATALQAVTQILVCLALIALIARPKEVCRIAYHLLLRLHRQAHSLPRNVQNVHRAG